MPPIARRRREESEMRTDLSIDRAMSVLRELGTARLRPVTAPLFELRLTETGGLRFPGGVGELSEHARRELAVVLETSIDAVPTDGDLPVTAVLNARLARATDRVCLRLVRAASGIVVRAIVEPLRPAVREDVLADVLVLLGEATACGVDQGQSVTLLAIRTGRRFDAGGWPHEHGFVVSLDERGLAMAFAAVFPPRASVPALGLVQALRVDAPPFDVAEALRCAVDAESSREALVREAQNEHLPRPRLMTEIFLDHPAIPAAFVRRVADRISARAHASRYDVAAEMVSDVEHLNAEARLAVAWRAGDVLLIDE
jgi:hypothetical protein